MTWIKDNTYKYKEKHKVYDKKSKVPAHIQYNTKTLTCSDVGFDCPTVIKGETEEEIM